MSSLSDFYKLVEELTALLKVLKVIEENKLTAITEKDLSKLDACIKDEQVQVMKLKGIEKRRNQLQSTLGYKDLTFKQIIDTLKDNEKKDAQKLFNELQAASDELNTINKSVKTSLEVKLYAINKLIEKTDAAPKNEKVGNNYSSTNRFV